MPYIIDHITADTIQSKYISSEYLDTTYLNGVQINPQNLTGQTTQTYLYVSPYGSDLTGERNNPSKPFLTFTGASSVAISGDTVIVNSGQYNNFNPGGNQNIHKDGVNWHFMPGTSYYVSGVTAGVSNGALFNVTGSNINLKITGYLDYRESSTGPDTSGCNFQFMNFSGGSGHSVYVEDQNIQTQSGGAIIRSNNSNSSSKNDVSFLVRGNISNTYPGVGQSGSAHNFDITGEGNLNATINVRGTVSNNRTANCLLSNKLTGSTVNFTAGRFISTGNVFSLGGCVNGYLNSVASDDDFSTYTFNGDFYDNVAVLFVPPVYTSGHRGKIFNFNGNFIGNSTGGSGIYISDSDFNSKINLNATYTVNTSATSRNLIYVTGPALIDWTGNINLPNTAVGANSFFISNADSRVTFRGSMYDQSSGSPIVNMVAGDFDWVGGRYQATNIKNTVVSIANNAFTKNISFRNNWCTLTGSSSANTFVDIQAGASNANVRFYNTFVRTVVAPIIRTVSSTSSANVYFGNSVLENSGGTNSYTFNGTNTVVSVNSFTNVAGINTGGSNVGTITVDANVRAQ